MTKENPSDPDNIEVNAIVERLYEVAFEPEHYESLLDTWEAELAPLRAGPKARNAASQLEAHVERASVFLDRYAQGQTEPITDILNRHAPFSAIAIDSDFSVIAANFDTGEPRGAGGMQLSDIPFLPPGTDADVRALAAEVFRSQTEVIQALSGGESSSRIALVKLRPAVSGNAGRAVVAVFSHIHWSRAVEERLRRSFSLSKTEAEIVRLVLEMKGRSEIARLRNRSAETIKRHLSSIYRKVGCRSSSELLVVVMAFINLIADEAASEKSDAAELSAIDVVPGNGAVPRRLNFVEAGAREGRPCIHLPGPYCLSQWPRPAEQAAALRDIRVITPIRAGYGPSPHRKTDGDLASDVASEIVTVMDALCVEKAPIVTQSNDIVFAFRLARKHPNRVSAIIACGGATPMERPEQFNRMDKWHRFVLANGKFAPRLLPFLVKAGFLLARRIGKQRFLERVYANVPGDMQVISDPECRRAILEGSRFALSDGVSAHAAFSDVILYFGRPEWAADVRFAEGRIPVYLINGDKDPMVRPKTLSEIAAAYPWINVKIYEGAGEFVFFQHWPAVMDLVERHAE